MSSSFSNQPSRARRLMARADRDSAGVRPARLDDRSRALRRKIVEVLQKAGRGHVGSSLSLVEIMRVLFDGILRYDPAWPDWPERDRLILSKGHGCLALYIMLAEKGFFPEEELWKFCHVNGILG